MGCVVFGRFFCKVEMDEHWFFQWATELLAVALGGMFFPRRALGGGACVTVSGASSPPLVGIHVIRPRNNIFPKSYQSSAGVSVVLAGAGPAQDFLASCPVLHQQYASLSPFSSWTEKKGGGMEEEVQRRGGLEMPSSSAPPLFLFQVQGGRGRAKEVSGWGEVGALLQSAT